MDEVMLLGGVNPELPVDWLVWNRADACLVDRGQLQSGSELASLRSLALSRPCYLILPQEKVLSAQVSLPSNSRAARQAIPFQLEEQLCEDPDQLHFVVGQVMGKRRYSVLVVSRRLMKSWRDLLIEAELPIKGIFADAQMLDCDSKQWSMLDLADRVLLKSDGHPGIALSQVELEKLRPMLEREAPIQSLDVRKDDPPLVSLARYLNLDQSINLMQGDFKLRDPVREQLQHWRIPALLILLLGVLGFAQLALENYRLSSQKDALDQQVERVYRETFPDARRIVNPRLQMERRLEQLRQSRMGAPFLRVLDKSVAAFHQQQEILINTLLYDAEDQRLVLELEASNAERLQQFNDRLQAEGLNSQLGQFSSTERMTQGRLTITEVR